MTKLELIDELHRITANIQDENYKLCLYRDIGSISKGLISPKTYIRRLQNIWALGKGLKGNTANKRHYVKGGKAA